MEITPVSFDPETGTVYMIDQRLLPGSETILEFTDVESVASAIRDMVVRGAPAIGIAAAFGMALAALNADNENLEHRLQQAATILNAARPTAVNLSWAVSRMMSRAGELAKSGPESVRRGLVDLATSILSQDVETNRAIGANGADLLGDGWRVMTHCNAGALATGGYGTALGVIRAAREAGRNITVISCETRPYLQGARLTCWELVHDGFDVTLISDNSAAWQMSVGKVDCVIVGADRIAANGDTANKIGTLSHAIAADRYKIPFYVAAPRSTLDLSIPDGSFIPVEERSPDEVTDFAGVRVAAKGVGVMNPSFDVTPWSLITAIITEDGVHKPGEDGFDLR